MSIVAHLKRLEGVDLELDFTSKSASGPWEIWFLPTPGEEPVTVDTYNINGTRNGKRSLSLRGGLSQGQGKEKEGQGGHILLLQELHAYHDSRLIRGPKPRARREF